MQTSRARWFIIIESQFNQRCITCEETKFYTAIKALLSDIVFKLAVPVLSSQSVKLRKAKGLDIIVEWNAEVETIRKADKTSVIMGCSWSYLQRRY